VWRRGREDAFPPRLIFCHRVSGVPLFWPWVKNFRSPLILIHGVRHKDFAALFSLNNVWSCTYELLTCGAITAVALVTMERKTEIAVRFNILAQQKK
jgi:hypothetical protein